MCLPTVINDIMRCFQKFSHQVIELLIALMCNEVGSMEKMYFTEIINLLSI